MTFYHIRHLTRFRYSTPISESVMEARMQPRTEGPQRCLNFSLTVTPKARVSSFRDHLGNMVHGFDIPAQHSRMVITAEAEVEVRDEFEAVPDALDAGAWDRLDQLVADNDYWDMLMPSRFAQPTAKLLALAAELNMTRRDDPLSLLREINSALYNDFSYKPQSTQVDSSIDEALESRAGVCQDYSHIMIALVRHLKIPCRYVSGYLFHRRGTGRADRSAQDATHAWVEALLPDLGWVGFDPTNNLIAAERHIRVAIGRDYADVPPTRGIFRGDADGDLTVAVTVSTVDQPPESGDMSPESATTGEFHVIHLDDDLHREHEQQQQ